MRWDEIGGMSCSVARALSVVGDRWTFLIIRELFMRSHRFEEFQTYLQVAPFILTERLNKLVRNGVIRRAPYQDRPVRYAYRLTEKGLDLYPVLVSLMRWGDRWMVRENGPPVRLVHKPCGRAMTPALVCPECGEPVEARQVAREMGPALRNERLARRRPVAGRRSAKSHEKKRL